MTDIPARLHTLAEYLPQLQAIDQVIEGGFEDNGGWWVDFVLDGDHPNAWKMIKLLGFGLNIYAREYDILIFFYPMPHMTGEFAAGNRIVWRIRNMTETCTPETAHDVVAAVSRGEYLDPFAKH